MADAMNREAAAIHCQRSVTNRQIIIIAGPPRSGTTIVAHLLSLHPNVWVGNETHWPLSAMEFGVPCDVACKLIQQSRGRNIVGDKSPAYVRWIDNLLAWAGTQLYVIGTVREPSAIVRSIHRAREVFPGFIGWRDWMDSDIETNVKSDMAIIQRVASTIIAMEALDAEPEKTIHSMLAASELDDSNYPYIEAIDVVLYGNVNRAASKPAPLG